MQSDSLGSASNVAFCDVGRGEELPLELDGPEARLDGDGVFVNFGLSG